MYINIVIEKVTTGCNVTWTIHTVKIFLFVPFRFGHGCFLHCLESLYQVTLTFLY